MENNKKFLKPELDVVKFDDNDIILTSNVAGEIDYPDPDNPVPGL